MRKKGSISNFGKLFKGYNALRMLYCTIINRSENGFITLEAWSFNSTAYINIIIYLNIEYERRQELE